MTNIEQLLTALLNGETLDIVPRTRVEAYLKNCCEGCGCDGLPEPLTRADALLYALAEKLAGGGGGGSSDDGDDLVITNASYLFYQNARIELTEKLCSLIRNSTTFSRMFYESNQVKAIPEFGTSEGTDFSYMFKGCNQITSIPELDTSEGTNFTYMFRECGRLTSIPRLDLNKATNLGYIFYYCSNLTDVYLYNLRKSIEIGSGTTYGHKLTVDSLVHIIKELCTVTSSQTLTIGSANLEKIANLYCKITDATHEKKIMELCDSTTEGAMTLTQYASEKGWQIK